MSGSSSVDIKVPVGSGYILDAISSIPAKTIDPNAFLTNYMLKSGEATDIAVTAGATTPGDLDPGTLRNLSYRASIGR